MRRYLIYFSLKLCTVNHTYRKRTLEKNILRSRKFTNRERERVRKQEPYQNMLCIFVIKIYQIGIQPDSNIARLILQSIRSF